MMKRVVVEVEIRMNWFPVYFVRGFAFRNLVIRMSRKENDLLLDFHGELDIAVLIVKVLKKHIEIYFVILPYNKDVIDKR